MRKRLVRGNGNGRYVQKKEKRNMNMNMGIKRNMDNKHGKNSALK